MATFTQTFEAGVNGNTITTSAGEGAATPWNGISGTPTYDNTHVYQGNLAAAFDSSSETCNWILTEVDNYGRVYLYATAQPSNPVNIVATGAWNILAFSTKFYIRQGANTIGPTATVIPLNQWIRIEFRVFHDAAVGSVEAKFFYTPGSSTPDETLTSPSSWNTGAPANTTFGSGADTWGTTIWMDALVANATSYPGPFVEPPVGNLAPVIYGRGAC